MHCSTQLVGCWFTVTQDPFYKNLSSKSKSYKKWHCFFFLNNNDAMRPQFCTCQGSLAAVICAKLWSDCIIRIKIRAKLIFKRFGLWAHKPFARWVPGSGENHTVWYTIHHGNSSLPASRWWAVKKHIEGSSKKTTATPLLMHWSYCSLALSHQYIDGLEQDCSNSIANALVLLQSCTKPPTYNILVWKHLCFYRIPLDYYFVESKW